MKSKLKSSDANEVRYIYIRCAYECARFAREFLFIRRPDTLVNVHGAHMTFLAPGAPLGTWTGQSECEVVAICELAADDATSRLAKYNAVISGLGALQTR